MKKKVLKITASILLLAFVTAVLAGEKISLRTNIYSDNTGTTVQSPAVEVIKNLFGKAEVFVRYSLDRVIVPPPTNPPIDGVTGASRPIDDDNPLTERFIKERNEVTVGMALLGVAASYYYSDESDYLGKMATVSTNFDFNQKNSNLAMSYSYGWDRITPFSTDTLHRKITHNFNATLTQALSPNMIGRVGVDFQYVDGFQSNPYRTVRAAGQIVLENHPLYRSRGAVFVKLNRYFSTRTAVNAEFRFYRDDWDVMSKTLSLQYHQYFNDKVLIRYRYRYYDQTASNFFRTSYGAGVQYMTSDYKLEKFTAHLFGLKIEYKLKDLLKDGMFSFMSSSTFEAKYERYFSSNDFIADIFQVGLVFNY